MTFDSTINASLFVPPVDEQVSGALREPRQGGELDEARNGVTGKEILPTLLTAQDLSVSNPQSSVNIVLVLTTSEGLERFASAYLSPTTCPNTTPKAVKTAEDSEIAPLKRFGALSPKYMGCTFMLTPAKHNKYAHSKDISLSVAQMLNVLSPSLNTCDFNDIPALIPTRKREITIISNDLEALLLTAKRAPVMRKRLFSNRQFFLWMREKSFIHH